MKRNVFFTAEKINKKTFFIAFLFFSSNFLFAQNGIIKGKVFDTQNDESLIGASVTLTDTSTGSATDFDGNFTIANLKPGSYNLTVSYVSYKTQSKTDVIVEADKETVIAVKMEPADIVLTEVQVVARANRESEGLLLLEQKQNLLSTQAVGAKEMSRKGVSDAESAVAKVAGISKQEGVKNVFVRGLGDRYNATLFNGFPIPSEDPECKNIALDFFGTNIIQSIGINKVFGSSIAGDVGGAVIDIASKELIGNQSFSLEANVGANAETLNNHYVVPHGANYFGFAAKTPPATNTFNFKNSLDPLPATPVGYEFGFSGGKCFKIGNAAYPLSFFAVLSHGKNYAATDEIVRNSNTAGVIYQNQRGKKYSNNTNQLGLANILFVFNAHRMTYNFMMVHANNQYVGEYTGLNGERFQDSDDYWGFLRRQQTNDNLLLVNQLMSDWGINDKMRLKVGMAHNKVKGAEPDRRENYFSRNNDGTYSLTGSNRQKRFFSMLTENDFNVKVNLTYKLNDKFGQNKSNFQVGYNGRFVDDHFQAQEYNFTAVAGSYPLGGLKLDDIYNPTNYAAANFKMTEGDLNKYSVNKFIHSPYVEINYQLTNKLSANAGLKADKVDMTVSYRVQHVSPGKATTDKLYLLPALNLKYDMNDKNSLRLGVSKTYTLPQSKEISPYQYVNISFSSQGNAKLKPSDNYNADLKWDFYPTPSELISLTGFYKHIVNPIARVDIGNSAGLLTYDNISKFATVWGAEMEIRKNIFSSPNNSHKKTNRLSAGLNASYIYTNLTVDYTDFDGKTQSRNTPLEGASPVIVNFDISHNYTIKEKNFTNSVVFHYFSNRVYTIGSLGFKNIMESGVPTLSFVSSSKINKNFTIKLNANNILNPSFRLTRENTDKTATVTLSEFKKGINLSIGVNCNL